MNKELNALYNVMYKEIEDYISSIHAYIEKETGDKIHKKHNWEIKKNYDSKYKLISEQNDVYLLFNKLKTKIVCDHVIIYEDYIIFESYYSFTLYIFKLNNCKSIATLTNLIT